MNAQSNPLCARGRQPSWPAARWALCLGLAFWLATSVAASQASAQSFDDFEAQADGLQKQVGQLEERYLKPALLRSRYQAETRFNDAKVAYVLEDYSRAAILFVGFVDNPNARQFDSYSEALYLLGDSLYRERNFLAARQYFRKVVDEGDERFKDDAIVRLLEIAAQTRNYEGVDELYDSLDDRAELNPAVSYVRGKTLYEQGRYADARRFFQRATRDPEFSLRANYFRGVAFAAEEQLENAKQIFEATIADHQPQNMQEQELIDLTYLALGRISYEDQEYDAAVDHYQHLKRSSDHFDRMLYELTWTFIAQGNYKAASRVADIFMYLSNPDPTFIPKVKLLKADLHLRLQQYDAATLGYEDVVGTFVPVKRELEAFVDDTRDLETFFYELVEAQVRGENPEYMPQLVRDWVDGSNVLDEAKISVADLAAVRQSIDESYGALEEMEARLESGARIQSFPKLAEGMTMAIELESRLVNLRRDMLEAQRREVGSTMSDAEKDRWKELDEQVAVLRDRYQDMPKTRAEVERRDERVDKHFHRLRDELDEVTLELDAQREQLQAVDGYLADHEFSGEKRRVIEERRRQAKETIAALRELRGELRRQVDVTRQKVGMGDSVTAREQKIRQAYRQKLAEQRRFLERIQERTPAADGSGVEQLQTTRRVLSQVEARLEGFLTHMNELVGERSDELRQDLASERKMLALLDKEVAGLMRESKDVTAAVAHNSFKRIQDDFGDIIMRGDVGLIDVAWQKKEDVTRDINQLFEDRSAELKTLQEAFEEVR